MGGETGGTCSQEIVIKVEEGKTPFMGLRFPNQELALKYSGKRPAGGAFEMLISPSGVLADLWLRDVQTGASVMYRQKALNQQQLQAFMHAQRPHGYCKFGHVVWDPVKLKFALVNTPEPWVLKLSSVQLV